MIRAALLVAGLLASLTLVVWRQSRALAMQRTLEAVRQERVVAEARRATLTRRVEELESRARVAVAARERLGMRVPSGAELVILPLTPPPPAATLATGEPAARGGEG